MEAIQPLGEAIGPLLVQLPPSFEADTERLRAFLGACPGEYRWVMEFRHRSWLRDPVLDLLAEHGVGLCVHDALPRHPRLATADWVYWRFHGKDHSQRCPPARLREAARWMSEQRDAGRDVYAYFNNDGDAWAPDDARRLLRRLESRDGRD